MFSLLFFEMDLQSRFRRSLWAALFLISAAGTCLSVTSGVIFVTALAFSYGLLFTDWRKWNDLKKWMEKKELWIAFLFFSVFVLLWYGLNYSTLARGQTFGASVASPGRFLAFAWHTITELPLTLTIPLTLAAAVLLKNPFQRRIAVMGLLSALLVLLSALVFKAGDPRVYIPLIPILALPAALIFDCPRLAERSPRLILPVFGVFLLITGLQFKMRYADMNPPDMGGVFVTAAQTVPREACPFNLAPTTSSTATLALGDALAMTLLKLRKFTKEKYGRLHPSGAIGRAVTMRVSDVMRSGDRLALVPPSATIKETILAMTKAHGGSAVIIDENGALLGIFTDGDFRRKAENDLEILSRKVGEVMTRNPASICADALAVEVLKVVEARKIDDIIVLDDKGKVVGIVDIQDLPGLKLM